jgi:hypothetical protein
VDEQNNIFREVKMMSNDKIKPEPPQATKPTFKRPAAPVADPLSDQAKYFAYWEAQRQERIRRERENDEGLSIYEQSRRRPTR